MAKRCDMTVFFCHRLERLSHDGGRCSIKDRIYLLSIKTDILSSKNDEINQKSPSSQFYTSF
jgi:hypothetical protein